MNLNTLITPDTVICKVEARSKKSALEILAELLAIGSDNENREKTARQIFQLLIEREKLGSTGMGRGVALPHARADIAPQPIGAFITLKDGIDFDSPDEQATDLIFGLLVPEHCTSQHLEILAQLAELFSDTALCHALRKADTAEACYQLLTRGQITSQAS